MNSFIHVLCCVFAELSIAAGGGTYGAVCSVKHDCVNGGTCDPDASGTNGACTCPTGYGGGRCQIECSTNADCLNGGTCALSVCTCAAGYTGGKCGTVAPPSAVVGDICSSGHPCSNGGTCDTTASGGVGACTCPSGYAGKRCQAACSTNGDCMNGGTCALSVCTCAAGYTGGKCETKSGAGQVAFLPVALLVFVSVLHVI
ncbi:notch homolog 2 N-terminal-like protein C [Haliotis rufescens]|uniref:notch homolog 2 N-terminal-like protein C n=1 Tax=Haliotis rufescens TaxID=6454 RepID=UPI001EB03D49|nr:notch homolog 2 N-terminal-like protein C [Haliotis rufescens]